MEDAEFTLSFPLNDDGFLRRACPTCSREFKWFHSEDDGVDEPPEEYFCPYCGVAAALDERQTGEQMRYSKEEAVARVMGPTVEDLERSFGSGGRSAGGLFKISMSVEMPERRQAAPVFEPNDMRRIDFACHPMSRPKSTRRGPVRFIVCSVGGSLMPRWAERQTVSPDTSACSPAAHDEHPHDRTGGQSRDQVRRLPARHAGAPHDRRRTALPYPRRSRTRRRLRNWVRFSQLAGLRPPSSIGSRSAQRSSRPGGALTDRERQGLEKTAPGRRWGQLR